MRSKGNTYKSKREEIAQLQAEYVTLKRTEEIIKKKYDSIKEHLVNKNFLLFELNFVEGFERNFFHFYRRIH